MKRVREKEHGTGRWAVKHGARSLSAYIEAGKIDGRTFIGKALRDLRLELAADAGGLEHMTARERLLIDRCAAAALICMTIEGHVFTRGEMIEAGDLLPILRKGYTSHVQSLSRMLQALGLRPDRADKAPDLQEYLAARSAQPAPPPSAPPVADTDTAADAIDAADGTSSPNRPGRDATEATTE